MIFILFPSWNELCKMSGEVMKIVLIIKLTAILLGNCDMARYDKIIYAKIGETVVLWCRVNETTQYRQWKRDNSFITYNSDINHNVPENGRLKIINNTESFYNLEISNITETDFDDYLCELHNSQQGVFKHKLTLQKDRESRYFLSTDKSSDPTYRSKHTSPMSVLVAGSSMREIFYYGIIAGGFVLMLCLSIACNIIIMRRCKTVVLKPNKNEDGHIRMRELEDQFEMDQIEERNSVSSHYDIINENEMIRYPITSTMDTKQQRKSLQKHVDPTSSSYLEVIDYDSNEETVHTVQITLEKPYLDVIDDELYLQQTHKNNPSCANQIGINMNKNAMSKSLQSLQSDLILGTATKAYSKSMTDVRLTSKRSCPENVSISSSDKSKANCQKYEEYLNPYVPLIANEMEYTNSYSLPIKRDDGEEKTEKSQTRRIHTTHPESPVTNTKSMNEND